MPRPRQFEPEAALEKAMFLFWRKGYESTSVADLVEAMGINRFSLYNTFGDKHDLFLKVLEHYQERMVSPRISRLKKEGAGLQEIKTHFYEMVAYLAANGSTDGCLMTNTGTEVALHDPEARARVQAHFGQLREAFKSAVEGAVAAGELPATTDIDAAADFLVISVQGLTVYSKVVPNPQTAQKYIDTMFTQFINY